ncbi:MAG TPA: hypothetical protein PKH50_02470 [bacterium]|jgi:hypothetical protein|nr:hypothetical protein [bacterium]
MYYVLVAILALLIFVLFMKALGSVLKGIITTVFVLIVIAFVVLMSKSISGPVDVLGMYRIDNMRITKFER